MVCCLSQSQPPFRLNAESSDGPERPVMIAPTRWAERESNPHSQRRLIYSQRSSPPARSAHASRAGTPSSVSNPLVPVPLLRGHVGVRPLTNSVDLHRPPEAARSADG